jgi:hypothetical protein
MAEGGAGSTEGQYASAAAAAYSHSYQQGSVQREQHVGTYHSTGSENGSHEEMYSYVSLSQTASC